MMNIGVLEAGSAPNVVAESARADVIFRTGEPVEALLSKIRPAAPDVSISRFPIAPTRSSFACRKVILRRGRLLRLRSAAAPGLGRADPRGPGSILDAHTAEEKVALAQIEEAVGIYQTLSQGLLAEGDAYLEPKIG